jgi:hypothetical protein
MRRLNLKVGVNGFILLIRFDNISASKNKACTSLSLLLNRPPPLFFSPFFFKPFNGNFLEVYPIRVVAPFTCGKASVLRDGMWNKPPDTSTSERPSMISITSLCKCSETPFSPPAPSREEVPPPENFKMVNIPIIGATGYIGQALRQSCLRSGHHRVCLRSGSHDRESHGPRTR